MTNYSAGHNAEVLAERYLAKEGYKIISRNWKTKYCEIDLIAEHDYCVYFVEVKYRSSVNEGSGYEYITKTKLRQMQFAAELWVASTRWEGSYELSALSITGDDYYFIPRLDV